MIKNLFITTWIVFVIEQVMNFMEGFQKRRIMAEEVDRTLISPLREIYKKYKYLRIKGFVLKILIFANELSLKRLRF